MFRATGGLATRVGRPAARGAAFSAQPKRRANQQQEENRGSWDRPTQPPRLTALRSAATEPQLSRHWLSAHCA